MMGEAMTKLGEGELMEARRRRLLWTTIGIIMFGGAVIGFIAGLTAAMNKVSINEVWTALPAPAMIGLVLFTLACFFYGTWRFAKAADEVEIADNLWGSTASYYVYATLFPVWWVLAKARIVPEPQDWTIYFAALGGGGAIYLWRKWQAR